MAAPIVRKKRNFKALALDVSVPAPSPPQPPPIPTRLAPPAGGPGMKRKPPAMDLSKSKAKELVPVAGVETSSPNLLTVSASPNSAPLSGTQPRSNYHSRLTEQIATLDMNSEKKLDLKNEDLKELAELGQGNGGSVKKVEHVPTGTLMAKKVRFLRPPDSNSIDCF